MPTSCLNAPQAAQTLFIAPITEATFDAFGTFLAHYCRTYYGPRLSVDKYAHIHVALAHEQRTREGKFFGAFDATGALIGSITLSAYDHRIKPLEPLLPQGKIAEVGRCYIAPSHWRQGIATKLFHTALAAAHPYSTLYLHTHRFLPGGLAFWKRMGFETLLDEGGAWETVHMHRPKQLKEVF